MAWLLGMIRSMSGLAPFDQARHQVGAFGVEQHLPAARRDGDLDIAFGIANNPAQLQQGARE